MARKFKSRLDVAVGVSFNCTGVYCRAFCQNNQVVYQVSLIGGSLCLRCQAQAAAETKVTSMRKNGMIQRLVLTVAGLALLVGCATTTEVPPQAVGQLLTLRNGLIDGKAQIQKPPALPET